jgi:hypothetical protein
MEENSQTNSETERLQEIVDKAKTFNISNQALTPPQNTPEEEIAQIAIIRALEMSPKKAQEIFFEVTGTALVKGKIVFVDPNPLMNLLGGRRLLFDLKSWSEQSFGNIKEDDMGELMAHNFEEIWPYYWANRIRFEIDQMDMGHLKNRLQNSILVAFSRGKNAKALNVAGRTFSEDWGQKLLSSEGNGKKKEGILEGMNPFKKMG